jgi:hypothetical protein
MNVPWELLYDGTDFIALSQQTPISRYLQIATGRRAPEVRIPLRVLLTSSSPIGLTRIDSRREQSEIERALGPLVAMGILEIFVTDAELESVRQALRDSAARDRPIHIWHFIGHGVFDEEHDTSFLILESSNGLEHMVSGFELGTLFSAATELGLVVLNACEGALAGSGDPFAGVATALVERGVPAVVAMQSEITDAAGIVFAEELYTGLSTGLPVDLAVTEARRALFFRPNYVEWAAPVLFLRASEPTLFDVKI